MPYWSVLTCVFLFELFYTIGFGWMLVELFPALNSAAKNDSISTKKFVLAFLPVYFLICFLWLPVTLWAGYIHIKDC